jgi:predicted alpha/beta-fold hydrolase
VAYCPGYDIGVAWDRVQPFYSWLMTSRLKRHFLARHERALSHLDGYADCLAARDLAQFHRRLYPLTGCSDYDEYLTRSNPANVFADVATPLLVLNADDDPVCVVDNVRDHVDAVRTVPDALLVRTPRGSHCAFFEGRRPRSWANRLIAGYLLAAAEVLALKRD